MSALTDCYNISFDIERMQKNIGSRTDSYASVGTESGLFEPVTDSTELFREENWGKEYRLFANAGIDLLVGDRVTINGKEYSVEHISDYTDFHDGDLTHIEARIIKHKTN